MRTRQHVESTKVDANSLTTAAQSVGTTAEQFKDAITNFFNQYISFNKNGVITFQNGYKFDLKKFMAAFGKPIEDMVNFDQLDFTQGAVRRRQLQLDSDEQPRRRVRIIKRTSEKERDYEYRRRLRRHRSE